MKCVSKLKWVFVVDDELASKLKQESVLLSYQLIDLPYPFFRGRLDSVQCKYLFKRHELTGLEVDVARLCGRQCCRRLYCLHKNLYILTKVGGPSW